MGFSRKSTEDLFAELQSLQQKYDVVLNLYEEKLKESLHTEQSLIKKEADIQAIIENSMDSIWSIDTNYDIQYINDIFKESFYQSFGVQLTKGLTAPDSSSGISTNKSICASSFSVEFKNC